MTQQNDDTLLSLTIDPPTKPGWYGYDGGSQNMIFLLVDALPPFRVKPQWYVITDNGDLAKCVWEYIEQALGVFNLVPLVPKT